VSTNPLSIHTAVTSGSSTTTTSSSTSQTPATAPNVSNGGFLDFLIAVFAMILVLQSHKLTKTFLDHLFPGGGGGKGPGALMSGLLEGVGMSAGKSIFKGGKNLAKTGAGMTGAAAVGGLAAAHKHAKEKGGVFGKEGILGAMKKRIPELKALPPDGGARMGGPQGFTMGSSGTKANGAGAYSMSFGPGSGTTPSFSNTSHPSGMFDSQSQRSGAHTQLRPSAQNKLDELSKLSKTPMEGGIFGAFAKGAKERFTSDAKHKLTGQRGKYAGGANSMLGLMGQEFGDKDGGNFEQQMIHDSYVPGKALVEAADKNDPMALADLGRIGQHQVEMDEGVGWMEQGQTLRQALESDYDHAKAQHDTASQDVDGFGMMLAGYHANGQLNTPEYQQIASQYQVAQERQKAAKEQFGLRETQMNNAQDMIQRGEQRVISSQNKISKINMGWYPENLQSAPRMVQAAQARANRKGLSDLGQPPHARKEQARR